MEHRTIPFIGLFLTIVGCFLTFQVGTNLYYDHYGVLGTNMSGKTPLNLNQRHAKVEYLDAHKGEYNALLLGSSREGHVDSQLLSRVASDHYGKDLNFYNLSVFSGGAQDFRTFTEYFIEAGHPIEHVVIGIDMVPFFNPPDLNKANFTHHYKVTGQNAFGYYLSYLFQTSFLYLFTERGYLFGDEPPKYIHDVATGGYVPAKAVEAAKIDYEGYWAGEVEDGESKAEVYQRSSYQLNQEQKQVFIALTKYLDDKGITYDVFVNPLHPVNRTFFGEPEHRQFAQMLNEAGVRDLPDFSSLEPLLTDNQNFYDLRHFKPIVGDAIVQNLYPRHRVSMVGTP